KRFVFIFKPPGSPIVKRTADATVKKRFSFQSKRQNVGHKQLRNGIFVNIIYFMRSVEPTDTWSDGRFRFAHHHRYAIDEQYDVRDFGFAMMHAQLVSDDVIVI